MRNHINESEWSEEELREEIAQLQRKMASGKATSSDADKLRNLRHHLRNIECAKSGVQRW